MIWSYMNQLHSFYAQVAKVRPLAIEIKTLFVISLATPRHATHPNYSLDLFPFLSLFFALMGRYCLLELTASLESVLFVYIHFCFCQESPDSEGEGEGEKSTPLFFCQIEQTKKEGVRASESVRLN